MSENWIVTSLLPKIERQDGERAVGLEYQRLCLQSWRENGFRILSLNSPSETETLADLYPEVTFTPSTRDARALTGRSNPFIADLLSAALTTPAKTIGIVNSDILFEPSAWWQESLPAITASRIAIFRRYDTDRLMGGARQPLRWGFDCFFFSRNAAAAVLDASLPFALGSPWWDFWLPAAFAFAGHDLRVFERPICLHLKHEQTYSTQTWRYLGSQFAQWIVQASGRSETKPFWTPIVSACRNIQTSAGIEHGNADTLLHEVSNLCMALTASARDPLSGAPSPETSSLAFSTLAQPFEHTREGVAAEQLFQRSAAAVSASTNIETPRQRPSLLLRTASRLLLAKWMIRRVHHPEVIAILLQVAKQVGRSDAEAELTLKLYAAPH